MIQQQAADFLESFTGAKADEIRVLAQSGSARTNIFAHSGDRDFILTFNENLRENDAFFYFSKVFSGLKLNTPEIFKISPDRKFYIQEFVGKNTLSEIIENEGLSENVKILIEQSLQKLFDLQTSTLGKIDYSKTFEYEKYDTLPVMNDLFYFKSFIVDLLEIPYHKSGLLREFQKIISLIENLQPQVLMVRDFQARNIMVNELGEVYFIDYQSAMQGPAMYDVISFLFQAKANFPDDFKNEMLDFYISLSENEEIKSALKSSIKPLQLIRYLQVLGAYGFRGIVQKKNHFIKSLDQGIENLSNFSQSWDEMNSFPELKKTIEIIASPNTKNKIDKILDN